MTDETHDAPLFECTDPALARPPAALIERCCAVAREIGASLAAEPDVSVLNDVVLNQVLVRFATPDGDPDAADRLTRAVVQEI